ncbi:hypothetical protein [Ruania zhangjianzhongii]|uniref:hypothetical protein n=1 Tax=Ruania zhangjianzhongii TaxID=2603206 RepID=UPI0011D220BC|nr:hypothetical protein [Ruania zhangjianzhongii]
MSPDDEGLAPRPPSPLSSAGGQVRRWQILGVSILGGLAVVAFLLSLLLSGSPADTLRTVATVAAGSCAVIGVSFAVIGGNR